MESNILANIVAIKRLQKEVLEDTKSLCMMESNGLANFAAIKQLRMGVSKGIKSQCMMESYTLANVAAIKQLQTEEHQKSVHDGVKYPCKHCIYQATSNGRLKEHQNKH